MSSVRRARLWLGTIVEIRVDGVDTPRALRAIEAAFAEIASVHRLMSFHAEDSDLARLRLAPAGAPVRVNARTYEVLEWSLRIAAVSDGAFDPTVAAALVERGVLSVPRSIFVPAACADWRDIELLADERVRLRKPLWLDLGGIAKGYAVDRAIAVLHAHGAIHACVDAGGDLRVAGARAERIAVRAADGGIFTALELSEGALATSTSGNAQHMQGASRHAITAGITASVAAATCMAADALTKVVLANPATAHTALRIFGAQGRVHEPHCGWRALDLAA
ncbi:MAG: FAD:protein FMN transferase [Xanthomonadaceae bacterium]|nr:FAD:protein FMN transferase [Xanthomonadaceae bacterium]MDE2256530.1 FAD:protein FMN transferase [Xanthomonadaceae bacterium]